MSSDHIPETPILSLNESAKKKKIGIVVSDWYQEITHSLLEAAKEKVLQAGIEESNIIVKNVPGSFELPLGAQYLLEYAQADAVIVLGCLVKGETPHFHYIAESVTLILGQLQMRTNRPVAYGLLTVDNMEQAKERSGGKFGNKGSEAAHAALFMLSLKEDIRTQKTKTSIGFSNATVY